MTQRRHLNNNNTHSPEKAIIVGVGLKKEAQEGIRESLFELEDLVHSAGGETVGAVFQFLEKYQSATLIGTGKLKEIRDLVEQTQAQLVIFDHQLTGAQTRNLEEALQVQVLDRAQLILDIFALRAKTYEGQLQVELAQKMDQLPRMVGGWLGSLSRQAGGIGTRGPGESALEIDRRRARERIQVIQEKLLAVRKNRTQHRAKRKKQRIPSFALIGYTNSGKSTLLNQLTQSQVLTKDQVFATLDPTTRKLYLPNKGEAVITDTVGFIRKLPTHLIEAFKSTLEESGESDILLHVIDLSHSQRDQQIEVVTQLIEDFHWNEKPILYIFNKIDIAPPNFEFQLQKYHPRVFISAQKGENLGPLKEMMESLVQTLSTEVTLYFSNEQLESFYDLQRESKVSQCEIGPQGRLCKAFLTEVQIQRWSPYLVKNADEGY